MIPDSIFGRIVNSAGVQDRSLVLLDVLSVYLLQHLNDTGILDHMCFKGGISLRKVFARTASRFSRDIDFVDASYREHTGKGISIEEYYFKLLEAFDGRIIHEIGWKLKEIKNEDLAAESLRADLHFFVYGDKPTEGWELRTDNVLIIECSFRRPIVLPTQRRELRQESWFKNLEFVPSSVPVLQTEEATAEKVRASFQRNNARDIFDLHQYGQIPFDEELVRKVAVMKCWQDRGRYQGTKNFDPTELRIREITNAADSRLHLSKKSNNHTESKIESGFRHK